MGDLTFADIAVVVFAVAVLVPFCVWVTLRLMARWAAEEVRRG